MVSYQLLHFINEDDSEVLILVVMEDGLVQIFAVLQKYATPSS